MLDTDTCIFVMNHRDEALLDKFETNAAQLCISAITHSELCFGVARSSRAEENAAVLHAFCLNLEIRAYSSEAGVHYGEVRHLLTTRGLLIGANDLLIASHALSLGATLVSNNEREFRRIPQLRVENWLTS